MKFLLPLISKLSFAILLVIVSFNNINAQKKYKQSSQEVIELINQSQKHYSTDDKLINGCVYPLPNSKRKGNPYLENKWTDATIFIGNNSYSNQLIKYDLDIGDIILKAEMGEDFPRLVNLNKFQVDSLSIGNTLFVNSRILNLDDKDLVYFEQIYKGENSLYKKYKKIFINEYNNITPYGKYSSVKSDLFLIKNGKLNSVKRKSSFLKQFSPEKQKEIKLFIKVNKIKYSKASKQELKQLMILCNKISSI